jgi:hypothetical protein
VSATHVLGHGARAEFHVSDYECRGCRPSPAVFCDVCAHALPCTHTVNAKPGDVVPLRMVHLPTGMKRVA